MSEAYLTRYREIHQNKFPQCPFFTATVDPSYGVQAEPTVSAIPVHLGAADTVAEQSFEEHKIPRLQEVRCVHVVKA